MVRSFRFCGSILVALAVCGCAEEGDAVRPAARPAPHVAVAPPKEVAGLIFHLEWTAAYNAYIKPVGSGLERGLAASGYNVAVGTNPTHDIDLGLQITSEFEPSGVQLMGPSGKQHVHVSLSLTANDKLIDEVKVDYRTDKEGDVEAGVIDSLVDAIGSSPALARFAKGLVVARADAAEREQRHVQEPIWLSVRNSGCVMPSSVSACDRVQAFLAKYPDGPFASQATAMLTRAAPKLEALRIDEADWEASESKSCHADSPASCAKVKGYLTKHPDGSHADEATAMIRPAPTTPNGGSVASGGTGTPTGAGASGDAEKREKAAYMSCITSCESNRSPDQARAESQCVSGCGPNDSSCMAGCLRTAGGSNTTPACRSNCLQKYPAGGW